MHAVLNYQHTFPGLKALVLTENKEGKYCTPSFPVYRAQFKNLTNQERWWVVEYFL